MPPHHILTSLSVTSGLHFPSLSLPFADGLNCLIGGRGTGKSGVLHLIRFALAAPIPAAYAEAFDDYIQGTLGEGKVTLTLRTQHGAQYTCTRSYGSPPVVRDESNAIVHVSLDGDLFKIDAYAQNEIEGIARSPEAQLSLLDRFIEPDVRRIEEAVAHLDRKLAQNAAACRRLEDEIADDAAREAELPSVLEALKGIDLAGASDPREAARSHEARVHRGRERAAMVALSSELAHVRSALDAFGRDAVQKLARAVEGDLERGAHAEGFRRMHAAMQRLAGAVEGSAGHVRTEIAATERVAGEEGRALAAAHAKEDEAYQAIVARHDVDRERAAQSERLHTKLAELSAVAKRLADLRREHGVRRAEWSTMLAERTWLLEEKSGLRARVAEDVNAKLQGEVRVTLSPGLDTRAFAVLLADILHGANIRPASFLETIARRIPPRTLAALAEDSELGPLMELDPVKTGREERAQKILTLLRASGRLDELETVRLEDVPLLELRIGNHYRPSSRLSTGQRCACVLPLLLLQSEAPLLIDQAEDNLDNAFIYDVLVERIARAKLGRQLLLVTHNPNPPSLAAADRILVLKAEEDGHGELAAAGTFEEVKADVEMLEGGRKAFLERGRKYGLVPSEGGEAEP